MRPRAPKKNKYVIDTFLPEVTRAEQTAAYKLFHNRYLCMIANIHTETMESMLSRQPRGDESGRAGRRYAQELREVYLTIAMMTELSLEGATIRLIDPNAAEEIYEIIQSHLRDWTRHVQVSINRRDIPEDDLRALDMFAASVYPYARHRIEQNASGSLLGHYTSGQMAQSRLFRRHAPERQKEVDARARGFAEVPLQHSPMIDGIANPPETVVKSKWT